MVATAKLPTLPLRLTYEEFLTLPEDGRRYELIDGELLMFASPSIYHQFLADELWLLFRNAIQPTRIGRVFTAIDVKLLGDTVVQPDIVVILNDRLNQIVGGRVIGTPSALLEILSPSTRFHDLTTKAKLYAENGVPEYWIVDLFTESITVHELTDGQYSPFSSQDIVRSRVIPDLTVDVRALFAEARTLPDWPVQ